MAAATRRAGCARRRVERSYFAAGEFAEPIEDEIDPGRNGFWALPDHRGDFAWAEASAWSETYFFPGAIVRRYSKKLDMITTWSWTVIWLWSTAAATRLPSG